jgi:CheY-like chemotaxis protein
LSLARGAGVDVSLVDVNMPGAGCVEATRRLRDEAGVAAVAPDGWA